MNHIITDAIHGAMAFNEDEKKLIKRFIDDPLFQRLKRIKQLGCADVIFPCAVHSRFSHCLGACYIAKRVCEHLRIGEKEKDDRKDVVMGAALLHDIGHGPFSHAFESIFKDFDGGKVSHDHDWNKKFIESIRSIDYDLIGKIIKLFGEDGYDFTKSLISSQLDVDRLDYLLRDSHFCGVPYGNIDLEWIISCMEKKKINGKEKLCIVPKGIGSIEHYISSRRLMTKFIYHHGKKNSAEYMIKVFLMNLEKHIEDGKLEDSGLFSFMSKFFNYKRLLEEKSNEISKSSVECLKESFINESFASYKNLTDDDIWIAIKKISNRGGVSGEVANRIVKRELLKSFPINPSRVLDAREIEDKYKKNLPGMDEWKIYIDNVNFESYKTKKEPIYIAEKETSSDIYYASNLLNQISDKSEPSYFLYIDEDLPVFDEVIKELNKKHCLATPYIKESNDSSL